MVLENITRAELLTGLVYSNAYKRKISRANINRQKPIPPFFLGKMNVFFLLQHGPHTSVHASSLGAATRLSSRESSCKLSWYTEVKIWVRCILVKKVRFAFDCLKSRHLVVFYSEKSFLRTLLRSKIEDF